MGKLLKSIFTIVGAISFTTLGIFASDALNGIDSRSQGNGTGVCDSGMVPMKVQDGVVCVDMYEASPSADCPNKSLSSIVQSEQNINTSNCFAATVSGAEPWKFISLPQAQRLCAQSGKRLPTSDEWYHMALGTNPEKCVVNEATAKKTGESECLSAIGTYDAVGNMWEWVDENIQGNQFEGRTLPPEGYVQEVDANGVATVSADTANDFYSKDYFWSKTEGVFGMIRGGYYDSGTDAGLYTVNASVPTSFATPGVGFRCVEDVL